MSAVLTLSPEKKALEKQSALEQTPATHTGTQAGLQDFAGLPLSVGTIDLDSIGSFPPFPGSDLATLGEVFPSWDDSISTLAGSCAFVSSSSNLLHPANLMPSASIHNLETPKAVRLAAMAFRRTVVPRPNPVFSNNRNETLIHTAARGNDVATLQLLAQYGFPVNQRDNEGRTALHAAYEENHMEAILWLLEYGVDVNAVDKQGRSTLSMAVNNKCPIAVKIFLSHGANPLSEQVEQLRRLSMRNEF